MRWVLHHRSTVLIRGIVHAWRELIREPLREKIVNPWLITEQTEGRMNGFLLEHGIRLNLLGPFELRCGDQFLSVSARKDRGLLGLLALSADKCMLRNQLAGVLWSESSELRARDSLKQALRRLKLLSEEAGICLIEADRQSVRLGPDLSVDVFDLLDAADDLSEDVLQLRRGPFLERLQISDPLFRDWILAERARLDAVFAGLALRLMRRGEATRHSSAMSYAARRLLSVDPFNEEAVRTLMHGHVERGERSQALRCYEAARELLAENLGIEPEKETTEIADRIRSADTVGTKDAVALPTGTTMIAVLPFATLGGDPTQDYFADGLTEDIITDLGKVRDIGVTARSVAFALKNRSVCTIEVARSLGASHILQGSVRQDGQSVRVTARLVDGGSGDQIWADRFDHPLTDIFLLQDLLARRVVKALRGALFPDTDAEFKRGTKDVEAYKLFLKARSFYLRGLDHRSLGTAKLLLTQAVERDPKYAEAFALLALCEFYLSIRSIGGGGDPGFSRCSELARKAYGLDDELAEVRAAVGLGHYAKGNYGAAERELAIAAQMDPDLYEPPFFLARNHRVRGDRAQAARLYAQAASLRSEDYRSSGLLAEELRAMGRHDEATEALREAGRRLEAAVERHPDNTDALAFGASVYAELGRIDQAREWCRWAMILGDDDGLVQFNYNLARAFVFMGQADEAIERLARLSKTSSLVRRRLIAWIATDLDFAILRESQAFKALMEEFDGCEL